MKRAIQNFIVVTALLMLLASEAASQFIEHWKAEYRAYKDPKK